MRILLNALSTTNLSGRHVLLGHLRRIANWSRDRHQFVVLYHAANADICGDIGENVDWLECPSSTANWGKRAFWEMASLPGVLRQHRIDVLWMPTGTTVPSVAIPQVTYAMNPWALVRGAGSSLAGHVKAALQRRSYRNAMRTAVVMLFLSEYMRRLFRENAGFTERASEVVYTGLDDDLCAAVAMSENVGRMPYQVLSVSSMLPHKGMETVIRSIGVVRRNHGLPARLLIVGAWPDTDYERAMRTLVSAERLQDAVDFAGHASAGDLYRYYAESSVYCLMSRCESFGIPAVEAQAFGTPVVSSNCCAIPEVCGEGGLYPEPNDVGGTAEALTELLVDRDKWELMSLRARQNVQRFSWDVCSQPLMKVFDDLGSH